MSTTPPTAPQDHDGRPDAVLPLLFTASSGSDAAAGPCWGDSGPHGGECRGQVISTVGLCAGHLARLRDPAHVAR